MVPSERMTQPSSRAQQTKAAWDDGVSCRLTEATSRGRSSYTTTYQVEVEVEGGKPLKFGGTGAERETVLWLSRFLAGRIQRGR